MLYAIVTVLILILDQAVKYWTTLHLELNLGVKEFIPGLLHLRNYHNHGSAFSFLEGWNGARWLFLIVTVIFAAIVIYALVKKLITGKLGQWTAVCVLAGALGNGIDRALYGYVVDMLQFGFWKSFPIFNVADIFVTVGGVLFCVYVILHKDPIRSPSAVTQTAKRGPGGSVVTKPAPKRVAKPAEKVAEKPAPKRVAKPAVTDETIKLPEMKRPERRRAKQEAPSDFERIQRPVVARESFAEMAKRRPGEDPFAEWLNAAKSSPAPKAEELRTVEPEAPRFEAVEPVASVAEPVQVPVAAPVEQPKAEPVVEAPVEEAPVPPVAEPAPAMQELDVDEDMEFSLEDILNEFRDL